MLILRRLTKLFARRDVFPEELKKIYYPIQKKGKELNIRFRVSPTDEFQRQYNKSTNKARIDKLIKDLKTNPIVSRFEDAGDSFADTHYLEDYSSKSDGYVMFSKKINNADRLNYKIYEPKLKEDEITKEKYYLQEIKLSTCLDHSIEGKPESYVGGQTGTTWHSPKKSRNRNKNKKDDLN